MVEKYHSMVKVLWRRDSPKIVTDGCVIAQAYAGCKDAKVEARIVRVLYDLQESRESFASKARVKVGLFYSYDGNPTRIFQTLQR